MPDAGYIKFLKGLTSNLLELFPGKFKDMSRYSYMLTRFLNVGVPCRVSYVSLFYSYKMKLHSEEII